MIRVKGDRNCFYRFISKNEENDEEEFYKYKS